MGVRVNVHYFLPHLTRDADIVEVKGNTVGECIEHLAEEFPRTREWLFRKDGELGNAIDVFVNNENLSTDRLSEPVTDKDEISIVMMISGG